MTDPRAVIRSFVTDRFPGIELADGQDIFELGFVNSLYAMELVMFIEGTFSIEIPNEELTLDNFRTLDAMTALVDREAAAQTAAGS